MNCAEVRRQLPEPDAAVLAAVEEHLTDCNPCRAESEALIEVDRRLIRLGQQRLTNSEAAARSLAQVAFTQLGPVQPSQPESFRYLRWLSIASLLLGAALLLRKLLH